LVAGVTEWRIAVYYYYQLGLCGKAIAGEGLYVYAALLGGYPIEQVFGVGGSVLFEGAALFEINDVAAEEDEGNEDGGFEAFHFFVLLWGLAFIFWVCDWARGSPPPTPPPEGDIAIFAKRKLV